MELPQLLQVIVGFVALSFLYVTIAKKRNSKRLLEAPEPAGALPIIGHLHMIGREPLHRILGTMADKYGPVFTLRLGMHRAVVVTDQEVAKECFTTNDKVLATRPRTAAGKYLGYDYAMFGFAGYGPYWREMRKIANHELLSDRRMEVLKHVQATEIDVSIKALHELYVKKQRNPIKVEMKQLLGDLMLNVIVKIVLGRRCFGSVGSIEEEEGAARNFRNAMVRFLDLFGTYVVSDGLPFLEWMDLGGHLGEMTRTTKELDTIIVSWMEERREKRRRSGESGDGEHDFMDVMLSNVTDARDTNFDVDTIIKATCLGIILGATDTTTVAMTWSIALLLKNRRVLEQAQQELDLHVGKDRDVEESDIKKLVYLQAIIKETLRLYPSGPLLAQHEAIEDCYIGGFHVKAGTRLLVNVWKMQRNPQVWSDPLEFRPERFLTNHLNVDVRGLNFEYIPFGSGRRQCPGISFGLQVMQLTLARLLHEFELKTPSNNEEAIDMTEGIGITISKAEPLEVVLTPRLPFKL